MNENNTLYIVVPCYKEQEVLPETSKRLKEKVPDLFLLDIMLPDEDGLQIIKKLKGIKAVKKVINTASYSTAYITCSNA